MRTIGFRHVELVQDDLPDGKTFYFRINGMLVMQVIGVQQFRFML